MSDPDSGRIPGLAEMAGMGKADRNRRGTRVGRGSRVDVLIGPLWRVIVTLVKPRSPIWIYDYMPPRLDTTRTITVSSKCLSKLGDSSFATLERTL